MIATKSTILDTSASETTGTKTKSAVCIRREYSCTLDSCSTCKLYKVEFRIRETLVEPKSDSAVVCYSNTKDQILNNSFVLSSIDGILPWTIHTRSKYHSVIISPEVVQPVLLQLTVRPKTILIVDRIKTDTTPKENVCVYLASTIQWLIDRYGYEPDTIMTIPLEKLGQTATAQTASFVAFVPLDTFKIPDITDKKC